MERMANHTMAEQLKQALESKDVQEQIDTLEKLIECKRQAQPKESKDGT